MAESPPDRPAPILRGAPLRVGYVDYGVGALAMDARHLLYEPRAMSEAEVRDAASPQNRAHSRGGSSPATDSADRW